MLCKYIGKNCYSLIYYSGFLLIEELNVYNRNNSIYAVMQ